MSEYQLSHGAFAPMGVSVNGNELNIAAENIGGRPLTLDLFDRRSLKKKASYQFPEDSRMGDVCSMKLTGIDPASFAYRFRIGNEEFVDPYVKNIIGNEKFGTRKLYGLMSTPDYPFQNERPKIPWNESVFYLLNVRSFTKDPSSGCSEPGTFRAVAEKKRYLKELGVTGLILQPCYDFDENLTAGVSGERRRNLWGYTSGHYFAPKQAYSAGNAPEEFSRMVDELHGEGIEVILQFYFPDDIRLSLVTECIRYWALRYRVDGFYLMGLSIPLKELATDPLLADSKLFTSDQEPDNTLGDYPLKARNIGILRDGFLYDARKYLKSDEDMLSSFTSHILENPERFAVIHYLTNYSGFTLNDLVSFDQKHNEANGEKNRDGSDYNYSWNCGAEGKSRKKSIQNLRIKQIKNALIFLFLSQGCPMLRAGDEFLHTQNGNNNAYCQDNKISYLNWNHSERGKEILEFTKKLIRFRKEHPVFRSALRKKMMDYISCGYPDVSFHGEQAWAPNFANYNRHFGVLYTGAYEKLQSGKRDCDFFVAYNMHWLTHRFHPPKSPKNTQWRVLLDTSRGFLDPPEPLSEDGDIRVQQRSVMVLYAAEVVPAGGRKKSGS